MNTLKFTTYSWYSFLEEKVKMLPKVEYDDHFGDLICSLFEVGVSPINNAKYFLYIKFDIIMNCGVEITSYSTDLELYNMIPSNERDILIFDKVVSSNCACTIIKNFIYDYYTGKRKA